MIMSVNVFFKNNVGVTVLEYFISSKCIIMIFVLSLRDITLEVELNCSEKVQDFALNRFIKRIARNSSLLKSKEILVW